MWIAIWTFLVLAFIIVPTVLLIWVVRHAFLAASRVGRAFSQVGSDLPPISECEPRHFYPGAAMSTAERAAVVNQRHALKRGRAQAFVALANQAVARWQGIGFLSNSAGDRLEVEFIARGRRGESE